MLSCLSHRRFRAVTLGLWSAWESHGERIGFPSLGTKLQQCYLFSRLDQGSWIYVPVRLPDDSTLMMRNPVWVALVCGLWAQSGEVWILTLAITNCVNSSLGFFISKLGLMPETTSRVVMRIKGKWGQKVPIMPTISSAITTIITTTMGHFQQSWKPLKNTLICGIKNNLQMSLFTEQKQTHRYRKKKKHNNLRLLKGMDKSGAAGLTDTHNYTYNIEATKLTVQPREMQSTSCDKP